MYEEEFGFVRAFDWNADGSSIAFMRFDETEVPEFSMDIYGQDLYQYPYTFKYPKAGEEMLQLACTFINFRRQQSKKSNWMAEDMITFHGCNLLHRPIV